MLRNCDKLHFKWLFKTQRGFPDVIKKLEVRPKQSASALEEKLATHLNQPTTPTLCAPVEQCCSTNHPSLVRHAHRHGTDCLSALKPDFFPRGFA
jgi:hypothetical protein